MGGLVLGATCLMATAVAYLAQNTPNLAVRFSEARVGTYRKPGLLDMEPVSDHRGWHLVQVIDGSVHRDGVRAGPVFNWSIGKLTLSPSSTRVAYIGTRHDGSRARTFIVVDRAMQEVAVNAGISEFVFSPDSKRIAYREMLSNSKWRVVTDGAAGPVYDQVGIPVFSPDSRRLAYTARKRNAWHVVVNGTEGPAYDAAGDPIFSADGRSVAYLGRKDERSWSRKWQAVRDGVEGPKYDRIEALTFSKAGTRLAYVAQMGDMVDHRSYVVVDGVAGPEYRDITDLCLSADGGRVAYVADGRVVVDHKTDPKYGDWIEKLTFSPDGRRVAYFAVSRGTVKCVVDGAPGPTHQRGLFGDGMYHGTLLFSADSRHLAYVAPAPESGTWSTREQVVLDGAQGTPYADIAYVTLSPDGAHFAYVAKKEHGYCVVRDGIEGVEYDEVGSVSFSPDGHRMAYRAKKASKWCIVLDGVESRSFDDIVSAGPTFRNNGLLEGLAIQYDGLYRVTAGHDSRDPGARRQPTQ